MIRMCFRYLRKSGLLCLYILSSLVTSLLSLSFPLIISTLINGLVEGSLAAGEMVNWCLVFACLGVIQSIARYVSQAAYASLQTKAGYSLNADTIAHMQRIPKMAFEQLDAVYLNQQINHDANGLMIFALTASTKTIENVAIILIVLIVISFISPLLSCICVAFALAGSLLYLGFRKGIFTRLLSMEESRAAFFSRLQEQLSKYDFIRTHALYSTFKQRLNSSFELVFDAIMKSQRYGALYDSLSAGVSLLAQATLLFVSVLEIDNGRIMVGYLPTIISFYSSFSSSVQFFSTLGKEYQDSKVSYERVKRLWAIEEETYGDCELSSISDIQVENLSFRYQADGKDLFCGMTANFKRGLLYGISGPNGGGKSTLLKLIMGLYPKEYSGELRYSGKSQDELDLVALRASRIEVMEQEPQIIDGTVRDNLTIFAGGVEQSVLDRYIDLVGLSGFVNALPSRLDTALDDLSSNLSGGEKQKIALIRLLLKNPDAMLFDEPTSALDSASREQFLDCVAQLKRSHIILVVTHDEAVLNACDRVITIG